MGVIGVALAVKVAVFEGVGESVGVNVVVITVVGVLVAVGVHEGVKVTPEGIYEMRTGIQSREKSREVLEAMLVMRTRRLASSPVVQVCPQASPAPPKMYMASDVVKFVLVWAAVQVVPPSQESSMQDLGEPDVESTFISRRTSMPWMVDPLGTDEKS